MVGSAFGVKCDAVPGRLNQVFIQREGVFYGQRFRVMWLIMASCLL